jgi:epoxide hydrolase
LNVQSFRADIPQVLLDDLQARLRNARLPSELPDAGWTYGVPLSYVQRLLNRWRTSYDWRNWEAKLNTYPQVTTEIDGQKIHFLHVRSPEPDALPLILTHGWPGSVFEWLKVIEPLTNPRKHGNTQSPAFHLVIPTLPGFGFSGSTHEQGWDSDRIARTWIELMHGLGYDQYGAVGNDWGSIISPLIARHDPNNVIGVHVTQMFLTRSGDPDELPNPTEDDLAAIAGLEWFNQNMSAYDALQAQQPQTLAYALTDSPVGLLAWFCQIFRDGEGIDDDFVLTNASLYWLTGTIGSSMRIYYERNHVQRHYNEPISTPIALAMFRDDTRVIRRLANRIHTDIRQWTRYDVGGHYAAHQVPELWISDVQKFFTLLRG